MERKSTHPVAAVAAVAAVAVPAVAAVATVLPTSSCHGLGGFAFHAALVYCGLRRRASMECVVLTY